MAHSGEAGTEPLERGDAHGAARTEVRIRTALSPDAAQLAALAAGTFRDTYSRTTAAADLEKHIDTFFTPTAMAAEISDPAVRTLLAGSGGVLVGYAQIRRGSRPPCPPEALPSEPGSSSSGPLEITRFYVDRAWHGRGVAQPLMQACLAFAVSAGWPIWLGVYEQNARAIAFYTKSGFRIVGRKQFVLGDDPQDDFVMAWSGPPTG